VRKTHFASVSIGTIEVEGPKKTTTAIFSDCVFALFPFESPIRLIRKNAFCSPGNPLDVSPEWTHLAPKKVPVYPQVPGVSTLATRPADCQVSKTHFTSINNGNLEAVGLVLREPTPSSHSILPDSGHQR